MYWLQERIHESTYPRTLDLLLKPRRLESTNINDFTVVEQQPIRTHYQVYQYTDWINLKLWVCGKSTSMRLRIYEIIVITHHWKPNNPRPSHLKPLNTTKTDLDIWRWKSKSYRDNCISYDNTDKNIQKDDTLSQKWMTT